MALPVAPTLDTIVTEALKKCGAMEYYVRAKTEWADEIQRELLNLKNWKALEETSVLVPTKDLQTLSLPSDYANYIKLTLYTGNKESGNVGVGTAQAGAAGSITLSASETITQDDAEGKLIFTLSGTGSAQFSRITGYTVGTKIAVVNPNWIVNPANGTVYMVPMSERVLGYIPWEDAELHVPEGSPKMFTVYEGVLYLDVVPEVQFYACVLDYYMDLNLVDLTSSKRTAIYREWRDVLEAGITARAYLEKGDPRARDAFALQVESVKRLVGSDLRKKQARRTVKFRSVGGMPRGNRWG